MALLVGVVGAVWSASGYVGAFGRAMNRIYEIEEGRPVWKLRPLQLLITLGGLVLAAAAAFLLASAAGGLRDRFGDRRRRRRAHRVEHCPLAAHPDSS